MKPNAFVKFWVWDFAALRVRRRFSKLSRQHVQPLNSISTAWSSSIRVHSAIDVGAGKFLGVRKIFARISLNLRISLNRISLKGSLVCPGFQVFCEHYHRFCLELARIFRDFANTPKYITLGRHEARQTSASTSKCSPDSHVALEVNWLGHFAIYLLTFLFFGVGCRSRVVMYLPSGCGNLIVASGITWYRHNIT